MIRNQENFGNQKHFYHPIMEKNLADDYETPDWFFDIIKEKFNITVDIAGDSHNSKIKGSPLFDQGFDALDEDWCQFPGTKFCFPPFTKPFFNLFLQKAHREWKNGESSVVLAPLKTVSVNYFQNVRAPIIYVIYPRLNFMFNGREVINADSICILHYSTDVEKFVVPNLHFLDLKNYIPMSQIR